jgi:hypothetical protein
MCVCVGQVMSDKTLQSLILPYWEFQTIRERERERERKVQSITQRRVHIARFDILYRKKNGCYNKV